MEINNQMVKTLIIFCFTVRLQLAPNKIIHPKVTNLSSTCLTDTQARILSKGLKIAPTPRRNSIEMENDIHNFPRELRLTEYFANENI